MDVEREEGMTLIELLIAAVLLTLVLAVAGGLVVTAVSNQQRIDASTRASNQAQSVTSALSRAVQSASALSVPTASLPLLVAQTSTGASGAASCQAFYYSATDNTIRTLRSTSAISTTAAPANWATWTILAQNVQLTGGAQPFTTSSAKVGLKFTIPVAGQQSQVVDASYASRYTSLGTACS